MQKFQNVPKKMPETLHWFKWEAYSTWKRDCSVYSDLLSKAKLYLIDAEKFSFTPLQSIFISLGFLAGGWLENPIFYYRLSFESLANSFSAIFFLNFFCIHFPKKCQLYFVLKSSILPKYCCNRNVVFFILLQLFFFIGNAEILMEKRSCYQDKPNLLS